MNETVVSDFVSVLSKIRDEYSGWDAFFDDKIRLKNLLADYLPKYKGDRELVLRVLTEGIPERMLKGQISSEDEMRTQAGHISKTYHYHEQPTLSAIRCWYMVLFPNHPDPVPPQPDPVPPQPGPVPPQPEPVPQKPRSWLGKAGIFLLTSLVGFLAVQYLSRESDLTGGGSVPGGPLPEGDPLHADENALRTDLAAQQRILARLGYYELGSVDGKLGSQMAQAIETFRRHMEEFDSDAGKESSFIPMLLCLDKVTPDLSESYEPKTCSKYTESTLPKICSDIYAKCELAKDVYHLSLVLVPLHEFNLRDIKSKAEFCGFLLNDKPKNAWKSAKTAIKYTGSSRGAERADPFCSEVYRDYGPQAPRMAP